MPGPEQVIRVAVGLPFAIARRVVGIAWGLVPGTGDGDDPHAAHVEKVDLDAAVAADDAMTREREPVEEATAVLDDDLGGHVEPEVELVAESADPEATEPPGPEIHVEDRR